MQALKSDDRKLLHSKVYHFFVRHMKKKGKAESTAKLWAQKHTQKEMEAYPPPPCDD